MYKVYISSLTSLVALVYAQTSNSSNNEVCQGVSTVAMSLEEVSELLLSYVNRYNKPISFYDWLLNDLILCNAHK